MLHIHVKIAVETPDEDHLYRLEKRSDLGMQISTLYNVETTWSQASTEYRSVQSVMFTVSNLCSAGLYSALLDFNVTFLGGNLEIKVYIKNRNKLKLKLHLDNTLLKIFVPRFQICVFLVIKSCRLL